MVVKKAVSGLLENGEGERLVSVVRRGWGCAAVHQGAVRMVVVTHRMGARGCRGHRGAPTDAVRRGLRASLTSDGASIIITIQ